jgi:hypothetical protein
VPPPFSTLCTLWCAARPPARSEAEYLVKWLSRSHVHNEWVAEPLLVRIAKRKLINFKRRHGDAPCNAMDESWRIPERFVSRRPSPCGPGWEVFVKWTNLGYDSCTWEVCPGGGLSVRPAACPVQHVAWASACTVVIAASVARLTTMLSVCLSFSHLSLLSVYLAAITPCTPLLAGDRQDTGLC